MSEGEPARGGWNFPESLICSAQPLSNVMCTTGQFMEGFLLLFWFMFEGKLFQRSSVWVCMQVPEGDISCLPQSLSVFVLETGPSLPGAFFAKTG